MSEDEIPEIKAIKHNESFSLALFFMKLKEHCQVSRLEEEFEEFLNLADKANDEENSESMRIILSKLDSLVGKHFPQFLKEFRKIMNIDESEKSNRIEMLDVLHRHRHIHSRGRKRSNGSKGGSSSVSCVYSLKEEVASHLKKHKKIFYERGKYFYRVRRQIGNKRVDVKRELVLGDFVKKFAVCKLICSHCYRENERILSVRETQNDDEIIRIENEKLRKYKIEIVKIRSDLRSSGTPPFTDPINSQIVFGILPIDTTRLKFLFNYTSKGCYICENGLSESSWNFEKTESRGGEKMIFFVCSGFKHRIIVRTGREENRWIWGAQYISLSRQQTSFSAFCDLGMNISVPVGNMDRWKNRIGISIDEEYKRALDLARRFIRKKYSESGVRYKDDTQYKQKQMRAKHAPSCHQTVMAGDENLIVVRKTANISEIYKDGLYKIRLPKHIPSDRISFKKIGEYLDVYEVINGKPLRFDQEDFDYGWKEAVEVANENTRENAQENRVKKTGEKMKKLEERYNLEDKELLLPDLEKMLSCVMEYYLRKEKLKISGTRIERKKRLEEFLETKEDENVQEEETEEGVLVKCLEKYLNYQIFPNIRKLVGVRGVALNLDGCKKGQAAGRSWFLPENPGAVIGLDEYHGGFRYLKSWTVMMDEFPVLQLIHFRSFFEVMKECSDKLRLEFPNYTDLELEDRLDRFQVLIRQSCIQLVSQIKELMDEECIWSYTQFMLLLFEDCRLFVHFDSTSEVESFHGMMGGYHEKGSTIGHEEYTRKCKLGVCDWNIRKLKILGEVNPEYDWKREILKRFSQSFSS